jgi:hypothetical protein
VQKARVVEPDLAERFLVGVPWSFGTIPVPQLLEQALDLIIGTAGNCNDNRLGDVRASVKRFAKPAQARNRLLDRFCSPLKRGYQRLDHFRLLGMSRG